MIASPEEQALLRQACEQVELPYDQTHFVSNIVNLVWVTEVGAQQEFAVRVSQGEQAAALGETALQAARHLSEGHSLDVAEPLVIDGERLGVITVDGGIATFWKRYHAQGEARPAHLGQLAKQLHRVECQALKLPAWDPFQYVKQGLAMGKALKAGLLTEKEQNWIADQVAANEAEYQTILNTYDGQKGIIHGDARPANVFMDGKRPRFGDFDGLSRGPRIADWIPLEYAVDRFFGYSENMLAEFAESYGFDIEEMRADPLYDTLWNARNLSQFTPGLFRPEDPAHVQAFRQRLIDIRRGSREKWGHFKPSQTTYPQLLDKPV